jgi:AAA domain (dynein-related subfamily)
MPITIKELKQDLKLVLKKGTRQPITPYIWGRPGIGKSQAVRQVADEMGLKFIDLRLSQLESSDLRGIPVPDMARGIARWLPPEFLPFDGVKQYEGTSGILLLDELNRARTDVLQAAFQLVLDRQVGMHHVMDSWFIVAAGNLGMEDKTDVNEFDSALKNRFIHFTVDVNLDTWVAWAQKANVHPDVINYLQGKPNHLFYTVKEDDNVFVTPRSWEKFSDILKQNPDTDPKEITQLIGSAIINGCAGHFIKYLESKEIISPKDIIDRYTEVTNKIKALQRDQVYQLNTELASYIVKSLNKDANKTRRNKALESVHQFCHDHLEKDIYIAFLQSLTKSCNAANPVNDFMDLYLKKYIEDSKLVISILKKN